MSGLLSALLSHARVLNAHSSAAEVAGKNLANVNNPDYARQKVIMGDRGVQLTKLGPRSLGLEALGIEHIRDSILDRQIVREIMTRGSLEVQSSFQKRVEAVFGEMVDRQGDAAILDGAADTSLVPAGLSKAIDDLLNGFHELSASPGSGATKQVVVQRAEILVDRFNRIEERLAGLDSDLGRQVETDVAAANVLLDRIANLNNDIARFELTKPGAAIDLRDKRQRALEDLAEKLNFEVRDIVGGNGEIQIVAKDGASADVMLVDGSKLKGSLQFDGVDVTFGVAATVIDLTGGSLYGILQARSKIQNGVSADIDALAGQLVTSVNQAYNPTSLTGDFFDATGTTAGSIRLDGSLSVAALKTTDTGVAGANELALAVAVIGEQKFSTGSGDNFDGTVTDFIAQTAAEIGLEIAGLDEKLENQDLVEGLLKEQRASISAVSLDEEITDMLRFQRAFQATARVISVLDEMLQTIILGLGR